MTKIYEVPIYKSTRDYAYIHAESAEQAVEIAEWLLDQDALEMDTPPGWEEQNVDEDMVDELPAPTVSEKKIAHENQRSFADFEKTSPAN
jgi:hypothetical protein